MDVTTDGLGSVRCGLLVRSVCVIVIGFLSWL